MALLVEQRKSNAFDFSKILQADQAHANRDYFITKSIVVYNLYGVDIMEEATEVCKLRLFLRLVADLQEADIDHIEPLPDIDFNIRPGNALVGFARLEDVGSMYKGWDSKRQQNLLRDVQAIQAELSIYRQSQLQFNPSAESFRQTRLDIRDKSQQVNNALDDDLYRTGKIKLGKDGSYSTRPFHWFTAFYEILANGGFDVIVGNPPYLELREVDYAPMDFETVKTSAIHSMCIERGLQMLNPNGCISMIVPLSLVSTQRMQVVQEMLEKERLVWYSNYSWRPGKLFDTVNRALTIFVAMSIDEPRTFSTAYRKWSSDSRASLIATASYTEVPHQRSAAWVPKLGSEIERQLIQKCLGIKTVLHDFTGETSHRVYYRTTGGLYWKVFTDFAPAFVLNGISGHSTRETWFSLRHAEHVRPVIAVLSSNLFWWWYTITSNCRDLNPYDIHNFHVSEALLNDKMLSSLGKKYLDDLQRNSTMMVRIQRQTGRTETQSFKIQKSKPIIDEIDNGLARHYGFTDEELDFIINYDIKYRMGRDAEEVEA